MKAVEAQKTKLAVMDPPAVLPQHLVVPFRRSVIEAYLAGFRFLMVASAVLSMLSALCAWFMID